MPSKTSTISLLSFALLLVTGCGDPLSVDPGAGLDLAPETELPTGGVDDGADDPALPTGWQVSWHPCAGSRTDALWLDDEDTAWVGCGTNAEGLGLWGSQDGGQTWAAVETDPPDALLDFRVDSLSRSADGRLYVAGIDTVSAVRVVSLDTSVSPAGLQVEWSAGNKLWNSFSVGSFRRASTGFAVAESLTGHGVVYRLTDDAPWQDGYGWFGGQSGGQILDLALHDDAIYGCGSTIADAHKVYLPTDPASGPGGGFVMDVAEVSSSGVYGELWSIDVDASGVIAGGVDQSEHIGVIYTSASQTDPAMFTVLSLDVLFPGDATRVLGVCRSGNTLVAVGDFSAAGDGLLLLSSDGGITWGDVTPDLAAGKPIPAIQRCQILPGGAFAVAGEDGLFASWRP